MSTKIVALSVLALALAFAPRTSHAAGKISKATAAKIVGKSGITRVQLNRVETKLLGAARLLKDTRPNHQVDNFELAAAIKRARLSAREKTAMWSAMGTAFMTSDPDGRSSASTKRGIVTEIRGDSRDLRGAMKGGKITADSLYTLFGNAEGKTSLSNTQRALLAAAKAAR